MLHRARERVIAHTEKEKESKAGSKIIDRFTDTLRIQMLSNYSTATNMSVIHNILRIFLAIMIPMAVDSQTRSTRSPVIFYSGWRSRSDRCVFLFLLLFDFVQMHFAITSLYDSLHSDYLHKRLSYYYLISNG